MTDIEPILNDLMTATLDHLTLPRPALRERFRGILQGQRSYAGKESAPLRLCSYCKTWNSKPCGEQCCWSPTDPTTEPQEAWQPIETAKRKDGTRIQAWDGKKQFICHFRGEHHEPHQDKPGWFEQHIRMHPTHWKPLGPSPLTRPEPQPAPHPDETVNFNGRLVTWAEIDAAVRKRNAALSRPRLPGPPAPPRWQPFYGARCAAYPNCSGGCGCGCTHEIEQEKSNE